MRWSALLPLAALLAIAVERGRALPPAAALRCGHAVRIDGLLRCDDEVPADVGAVCGSAHADAARPIHGGDTLDTALLCGQGAAVGLGRMTAGELEALAQPVDLNTASIEELEGLPGIGPSLAARIVAARPFDAVDALVEVRGVGPRTLERLRARVIVRPPLSAPRP